MVEFVKQNYKVEQSKHPLSEGEVSVNEKKWSLRCDLSIVINETYSI